MHPRRRRQPRVDRPATGMKRGEPSMMTEEELRQRTHRLVDEVHPASVDQFTFRGAQYDRGLAWVHFPEGKGGLGLPRGRQGVVRDVLREARVAYNDLFVNPIGIGMVAPTLL